MDVFIQNVPAGANEVELRMFLKETLNRFDILAFDVFKRVGKNFATVTTASAENGERFLQFHGSRNPLTPLKFRGVQLCCLRSNRRGQPDALKVRALMEKEMVMRSKFSQYPDSRAPQPSKRLVPIVSLMTGIWGYDHLDRLIFDSKYKDLREGTVTFGDFGLVFYLKAATHNAANWHCRVDIPYSTIEHTIPSVDHGQRGTLTFTLKSPPKIYYLVKTDDLHLYSGDAVNIADIFQGLQLRDSVTGERVKRMRRMVALREGYGTAAALCNVYRILLPDIDTADHAWNFVREFSALALKDCWKTMVPSVATQNIEAEYQTVEQMLAKNPPGSDFNFAVRYQLQALVLEGTVTPADMISLIPRVRLFSSGYGSDVTAHAVRKLRTQIPMPGPHVRAKELNIAAINKLLLDNIDHIKETEGVFKDLNEKKNKSHHLALTYKGTVTPTGMLLQGPDMGVSNRVLRKYSKHTEYFMRVFFADEDGLSVLHDPKASQESVYDRFRKILREGISVSGRTYEFLGFSHSSLHYHTTWFQAPFIDDTGVFVHARDIISNLGDFSHLRCSAKCAARIGQAFSDTIFSIPLKQLYTDKMPDIERNGHCFSDGCGTISKDLLSKVWKVLPLERREQKPVVLQIRYRGAKGVVSLDSTLKGEQLHIRNSMVKYNAREIWRDLELCGAAYRPLDLYLNHQFIKILEDLDIPQKNFLAVQNDALKSLQMIIMHPINAASFLDFSKSGTSARVPILFTLMHEIGLSFQADKFLTDLVEIAAMASLRDMKYRARIPVEKGFLLYGIMDESNELKEGEVYVATRRQDTKGKWQRSHLVGSRVVVTRAPALHPGDVQIVKAVDVSENSPLRSLYNCIVFSQQGARDLPSQLGGGDLDGDLFHVIFDERLIPSYTMAPSEYEPAPAQDLGRPAERDDIIEFFIDYMNSDRLGQISNKHKIRADVLSEGTKHSDCIRLAKLASDAVDFSKSGIPVDMRLAPTSNDQIRPDFMATGPGLILNELGAADLEEIATNDIDEPDSLSLLDPDQSKIRHYRSPKALGVLYRQIDEKTFLARMKRDFQQARMSMGDGSLIQKLHEYLDRETRQVLWEHHREFAEELREAYEENMLDIMYSMRPHRGKPLTELEVFSGNILGKKEKASTRHIREANMEVRERFNRDTGAYVRRMVSGDGDNDEEDEALPRAIACFKVSLETEGWENQVNLKSWKYVAAAVCLEQLWKYVGYRLRPL
ncbi:rna-dependent rna polymeras-like protein [Corynespora cassiicola Philippines]|uniref:RNA-dependent RNA polymerase n=1 Tax=Corynespora cassiicola Philippines TaxID=1448308 RepID=A0A2T2NB24_CORCC|nr:rna-dependent rna polymeras-like protein [Corynespora cassiicola Philippines]